MKGAIQTHYGDSSGVRAAVFFAGFGCTCAQLSINVILNGVSTGMVLAGFAPKYINIKRGAVLLGMLGLAVNPWQLTATASTFIGVISGFGIFIGRPLPSSSLLDFGADTDSQHR
jgi:NCS1 family nucleobase:cation symporter-1